MVCAPCRKAGKTLQEQPEALALVEARHNECVNLVRTGQKYSTWCDCMHKVGTYLAVVH